MCVCVQFYSLSFIPGGLKRVIEFAIRVGVEQRGSASGRKMWKKQHLSFSLSLSLSFSVCCRRGSGQEAHIILYVWMYTHTLNGRAESVCFKDVMSSGCWRETYSTGIVFQWTRICIWKKKKKYCSRDDKRMEKIFQQLCGYSRVLVAIGLQTLAQKW